jgi:hypothetical protein
MSYVSFFRKYATPQDKSGVPESAYFAAYEAARGYGDAMLRYGTGKPTPTEIELATQRYKGALRLFPFDRTGWSSMTAGLERQGRENDFLELVRPVADAVTRSRVVHSWVENEDSGHATIAVFQRALAEPLVLMYLGFSEDEQFADLEQSLEELHRAKDELEAELRGLGAQRERTESGDAAPASMSDEASGVVVDLPELKRRQRVASDRLGKLEQQIATRTRALPLYREVVGAADLGGELRVRRDHPAHTLLRRMYHESRGSR